MLLRQRKEVQEMLREVNFLHIKQPESYPLFTGLVSTNLLETLKMMRGISQIIFSKIPLEERFRQLI